MRVNEGSLYGFLCFYIFSIDLFSFEKGILFWSGDLLRILTLEKKSMRIVNMLKIWKIISRLAWIAWIATEESFMTFNINVSWEQTLGRASFAALLKPREISSKQKMQRWFLTKNRPRSKITLNIYINLPLLYSRLKTYFSQINRQK